MPRCCLQFGPEDISFCHCRAGGIQDKCKCGEDLNLHEWAWDSSQDLDDTQLAVENREVLFHPGYSSGTSAVRGDTPCVAGRDYYWEIKMLSPLYGTDVMVGVGTTKAGLTDSRYEFCSLLGSDTESWGYSYKGDIQHNGKKTCYGPAFGQGSIVGIHLDMWRGTLQFYLNRIPLGIAFTGLQGKQLYPMVSSTSANSSMRVTYSFSSMSTLQLLCLRALSHNEKRVKDLLNVPGFKCIFDRAFWWLTPDPYYYSFKPATKLRTVTYLAVESEEENSDTESIVEKNSNAGWLVALG